MYVHVYEGQTINYHATDITVLIVCSYCVYIQPIRMTCMYVYKFISKSFHTATFTHTIYNTFTILSIL